MQANTARNQTLLRLALLTCTEWCFLQRQHMVSSWQCQGRAPVPHIGGWEHKLPVVIPATRRSHAEVVSAPAPLDSLDCVYVQRSVWETTTTAPSTCWLGG